MITRQAALDLFQSDDLIAIAWKPTASAASGTRRRGQLHHRSQHHYTNFCTEYCSFCAFYRAPVPRKATSCPGNNLPEDPGDPRFGRHRRAHARRIAPDLKIEWYEDLFRGIKARYPIHLHCLSARK